MTSTKLKGSSNLPRKKVDQSTLISVSDFYAQEDEEATSLSWETLEKEFLARSNALKEQIDILASPEIQEDDLKVIEEAALYQLLLLRRLNRFVMYRNRHDRDMASEALAKVDLKYLQLQNVNNEIEHIQKEIDRCYEFKSADEDINLVSVEDFYNNAPPTISRKEVTQNDLHEQRIARLNWEMLERKNLLGTLQEREGRKNVLLSDISKKEYRLKSLKPKIESIIETASPVQELMSLKTVSSVVDSQRRLFTYLSKELTVIAIQTEAYRDIAEDQGIIVECQGDIENAIKFSENGFRETANSDDDDDLSETDGTTSPAQLLRRRQSTTSQQITKKKDLMLVEHPISLVITIHCDGLSFEYELRRMQHSYASLLSDDLEVSLQLRYLPELRSIAAKAKLSGSSLLFYGNLLCDESLLVELFPHDDGEACPDSVGQVKLEQLRLKVADYEGKLGRFYKFVQRMAGIGQGSSSGAQLCDAIQSVISEIRYRVRTRSMLIRCIKNLSVLKVFDEMSPELRAQYPLRIISRLTEFCMLTQTQFLSHEAVTSDYRSLIESECSSCLENQFFFSALIERDTNASLKAIIFIGTTYPKYSRPLFILFVTLNGVKLTAKNCSALEDLETELNLRAIVKGGTKEVIDLHAQIGFLISRFDCFLELQSAHIGSTQFPKEHLYFRTSRGRSREIPLAFDHSTGAFQYV